MHEYEIQSSVNTQAEFREGHYLDLLVFGQSVYDCDDEVFGKSKV